MHECACAQSSVIHFDQRTLVTNIDVNRNPPCTALGHHPLNHTAAAGQPGFWQLWLTLSASLSPWLNHLSLLAGPAKAHLVTGPSLTPQRVRKRWGRASTAQGPASEQAMLHFLSLLLSLIFRPSPFLRSERTSFTCPWRSSGSSMTPRCTCGDLSSSTTWWRGSMGRFSCRAAGASLPVPSVAPLPKSGSWLKTARTANGPGWPKRSGKSSTRAVFTRSVVVTAWICPFLSVLALEALQPLPHPPPPPLPPPPPPPSPPPPLPPPPLPLCHCLVAPTMWTLM